jgi:hypothetical protein
MSRPIISQVTLAAIQQRLQEALGDVPQIGLQDDHSIRLKIRVHRAAEVSVLRRINLERAPWRARPR